MRKVIVLGSGMVGSAIAIDMATRHNVTITDVNQSALDRVKKKCSSVNTLKLDVTNKKNLQQTQHII